MITTHLLDRNELNAWCALLRAPGIGIKTYHKIIKACQSPTNFYSLSYSAIKEQLPFIKFKEWELCHAQYQQQSYQLDLQWLNEEKQKFIICYNDSRYPLLLKQIEDAPPVLFVQGNIDVLNKGQLAVVGSRSPTPQASEQTADIVKALARHSLVITSGLALGIDGVAHRAALQVGGKTVAVVGTGLDRVYPARHHELAHQIAQVGAIVSEFPIGTGVRPHHFPRRNRIISGLSLGVFVSEASIKSGSLITAEYALEEGRELFAMPGSVYNPLARGCHQLIKQGAKLVENAEDILEELLPMAQASLALQLENKPICSPEIPVNNKLSERDLLVLNAMGYDGCHVDDLVDRTHLAVYEISTVLSILEIEGYVQEMPGKIFQRTKKGSANDE